MSLYRLKELFTKHPLGLVLTLIALATISRLIGLPPNFSPINAITVFAASLIPSPLLGLAVSLSAMVLSDTLLGFHNLALVVYASFALSFLLGRFFVKRASVSHGVFCTIFSGFLFFVITNFAVWLEGYLYPKNLEGLIQCFIAALPFYRNTFLSDLIFSVALFGLNAVVCKYFLFSRFSFRETK